MSEPTFGSVYHTKDGKTVYFDPKTKSVSVFEGILTIDKVVEPATQGEFAGSDLAFVESVLQKMFPMGSLGFDLLVTEQPFDVADMTDILGPKDYYILVQDKGVPLSIGAANVPTWVSEYKHGHHPVYPGFTKHKILAEQYDWLHNHRSCSVKAWYDQECPAFISLACQDHAKVIQPVRHPDEQKDAPLTGLLFESSTVQTSIESVLTEERDV
jgi:hypothetical protein